MKKGLKITLVIIAVLLILAILFFIIDDIRVQKQEKPLFCMEISTYKDGGTKVYYGLGYKVIKFHKLLSFNESSDGTSYYDNMAIGTWFMNYHDFDEQIESYEETIERNSRKAIMKAVVVKVSENHLMVLDLEDEFGLISVGFDENIGFKQGQEIAISFDGMLITTYPGQLGNVEKIEIIKEKSEKKIPDEILRYCYSSYNNVKVTITELTSTGIALTIEDSNELPYEYSHSYIINQKVKDETYTGVGQKIGENTGNSTAGFTRGRLRIYMERSK